MGRFDSLLDRLIQWGKCADSLLAAFIIGSQAREDHPADDFSDLDVVLIVEDPEAFLYTDQWLKQIGNFHISFVEDTAGGAKERRMLFDDALDVDFLVLSKESFDNAVQNGEIDILKRGYRFLIDKMNLQNLLPAVLPQKPAWIQLTESEFCGLVQDFWYHAVWAAKKIIRGERWTAKFCVDSYMKGKLLTLIECHAHAVNGLAYDTWHSGRFLEEWAQGWVVEALADCFAHYEDHDMKNALYATMGLFRRIAVETAAQMGYAYPTQADVYSTAWVMQSL